MDLNYTLMWMVGSASGLSFVAMLLRHRLRFPGWLAVYALNGIALAALAYFAPESAGFIGAAIWVPTVLVPMLGSRYASRLVAMQRYTQARRLLQVLAALHPFDGWREQPDLLLGLSLVQKGEVKKARRLFERSINQDTWLGRMALLHLYRMDARWSDIRQWFEEHKKRDELERDVTALSFYLRALGELEDAPELCRAYGRASKLREIAPNLPALQLFVAAFAGRPDLVEQLFNGVLAHFPTELKAFWSASSEQTAGDSEAARRRLEPIIERGSPLVTAFAERRLNAPLAAVERASLGDEARATLEAMAREIQAGRRAAAAQKRPPLATMTFLLINTAVFILETPRGSMDPMNLCRLGALILAPGDLRLAGEWWRLATACVLHFGSVHLTMNLLGLAFLGWQLERVVGSMRLAIVYVASGVGSSVVFVLVALSRGEASPLLVGASGCIMGVVGATAGVLLMRWKKDKTRVTRAALIPILVMLLAQSAFDLMTPQVSMLVHLSGATIGLLVGAALGELPPQNDADAKSAEERRSATRRRAGAALIAAGLAVVAYASAVSASPSAICDAWLEALSAQQPR